MPGETSAVVDTITEEKDMPGGDGRRWEDSLLNTAIFQVGAKDAKVCSLSRYHYLTVSARRRFGSCVGRR